MILAWQLDFFGGNLDSDLVLLICTPKIKRWSQRLWQQLYLFIDFIWATKFFTIPRRDTWDHSLVSLTYLIDVDEHSALPAPIAWKYLISNFPPSVAELFRLPPHRSGTHYLTQSFRHQHCGRSSTNNWKLFYFNDPLFISTVIVVSQ